MTEIILDRFKSDENGTFGAMILDEQTICFTCELPWRNNNKGISCIPIGSYQAVPYQSPKHGDVWEIQNVPGRNNIEIHAANFSSQLQGCIAVGDRLGEIAGIPSVLNSVKTLKALKNQLPPTFILTITN